MPHPDYRTCRKCGRHASEVGALSWTRLCVECGFEGFAANLDQLRDGSGPYFEHWARRCLLSAHKALIASRDVEP